MKIFSRYRAIAILISAGLLFGLSVTLSAQVTIVISKVPESTPATDSLYLVGSFNEWNPGDNAYRFTRNNDGQYSIVMPKGLISFQFKVTRGSWTSVEGDINGKKIEDRTLTVKGDKPYTHTIQVISWEDKLFFKSWNFIVKNIPENTPLDASLFVTGSFNDWNENDRRYQLTRMTDGTYGIKVPKDARDTIWFKFNRGNWKSVESRRNGRTQNNRIAVWDQHQHSTTIESEVEAWEDIGGGSNLLFSFVILASTLQAVVLIFSLFAIKRRNVKVGSALALLLVISVIALLARLASYNRSVFDWQPKLLLLSDLVYFLYAPVFYLLIKRIAGITFSNRVLYGVFYLVPLIHLVLYANAALMSREPFIVANIDGRFNNLFNILAATSTLYNVAVFALCVYLVRQKYQSVKGSGYQSSLSYLVTLLIHAAIVLSIWFTSHLIYLASALFELDGRILHEYTIDAVWIAFALSTYVHTFLLVRKPDLFKLKDEPEEKAKNPFPKENLDVLKLTLSNVMKKQRPFLNSKLGLQELAELMNVNIHTLSWIINDGYNKNFFDFVNEYRIEEFKKLAASDQYKNYTFLAIAMDVGFSSKTTFNRAFKKSTGKTPREFFSHVQESKLADISE